MSEFVENNYGKVGVLMGGDSSEREISLKSGNAVLSSLITSGVDACGIDAGADLLEKLIENEVERVFIILHGRNGEDGKVQGVMESIGMPYTGSGVYSSRLAMDKIACKKVWQAKGLSTPEFEVLSETTDWDEVIGRLGIAFVKPVNEGSSIGIAKAKNSSELKLAYENASQYDSVVLAEKWINGPEFTVAILGDKTLPPIELRTENEFYDFEAKYEAEDTQYICPCDLDDVKESEIRSLSKQAYEVIECFGWARVDLMQDLSGKFWLLEINTIPGMTDHSLVPMAAKQAGLSYEQLVLEILRSSKVEKGMSDD